MAFANNINGLEPIVLQFYQRPELLLLFLLYNISSFYFSKNINLILKQKWSPSTLNYRSPKRQERIFFLVLFFFSFFNLKKVDFYFEVFLPWSFYKFIFHLWNQEFFVSLFLYYQVIFFWQKKIPVFTD